MNLPVFIFSLAATGFALWLYLATSAVWHV